MQIMNYSEFRQNLASALDYVQDTHAPIVIKRGKTSAVMMSLDDYNAHIETLHLISSPANNAHLMRGIEAVNKNKLIQKELLDD